MATVLITGANRGIGLEFVCQCLGRGDRVIATCRNPETADNLRKLESEKLQVISLDVSSQESIRSCISRLIPQSISIFINNAGIYGPKQAGLLEIDPGQWRQVLEVNTMAPLVLTGQLLPYMDPAGPGKLVYLSSKMGSITDNSSGGSYIYRTSKTALNQVVRGLSIDLAEKGFTVAALHPGWVKTDMGGPNALISAETSVKGLLDVIDSLRGKNSGNFYNYDGSLIPW